jgi:large subunit ribosomal protein L29
MKGVSAKDLRGNEPDELHRTLRKLEEDLFKHRMKKVTNQLENTMLIRQARRDIARINTVLGDKVRAGLGAGRAGGAPGVPSAQITQSAESGKEK